MQDIPGRGRRAHHRGQLAKPVFDKSIETTDKLNRLDAQAAVHGFEKKRFVAGTHTVVTNQGESRRQHCIGKPIRFGQIGKMRSQALYIGRYEFSHFHIQQGPVEIEQYSFQWFFGRIMHHKEIQNESDLKISF